MCGRAGLVLACLAALLPAACSVSDAVHLAVHRGPATALESARDQIEARRQYSGA